MPTGTILEIGPGFGRWTQFLRQLSDRIVLVDLSERCIDACRSRFAGDPRFAFIVNDGTSLDEVEDGSIDFIFSFDSLVHAEADAVSQYLTHAARKLRPGGAGFIHHSNLRAFAQPQRARLPWFVTRRHWRGESMSADVFRELCRAAGLACRSQELINWLGRERDADWYRLDGECLPLIDCLSVFVNEPAETSLRAPIPNYRFVDEWREAVWIADVYGNAIKPAPVVEAPARATVLRKVAAAHRLWRSGGCHGVAAYAWRRARTVSSAYGAAVYAHAAGSANRRFLRRHLLRH